MKCHLFRTCIFLCFSLILLPVVTSAQSFKKGYRCFTRGDYPAAAAVFNRYREHEKYGAAARFFLARMRLPDERNLDALIRIDESLYESAILHQLLTGKQARRQQRKFGFDTLAIRNRRLEAQRWAIASTRARSTLAVLDSLLEGLPHPLPELRPDVVNTHRDIVNAHLGTRDYDTMSVLLRQHINYVLPDNYSQTREMSDYLWQAFLAKYPVCAIDKFMDQHPLTFAGRDCWREEVRQVLCSGSLSAMLDLHAANRWTALEIVLLNTIADRASDSTVVATLTPEQHQHLLDLRRRNSLRAQFNTGATPDTSAVLAQTLDYISRYAPRYSAFRLMEEGLQFFLERQCYTSAIALLEAARPAFPDTLPAGCTTNFDYQRRVRYWIDGKLPILRRPGQPVRQHPLNTLNTAEGDEFSPVVSADGREIYFAAAGRPDNRVGQDVFTARWDTTSNDWGTPTLVPELSGPGNQAPLSITADSRQLLLYVNKRLFLSRRAGPGAAWTTPAPLPVSGIAIMGKGCLSTDGNTLILEGAYSAGTPTQAPDLDLFVSLLDPATGQWSRPTALGASINTDEEEASPHLSPDGKILLYTSAGYPGLGRSDIFVSHRTGPGWTQWERPTNLGKELNNAYPHRGFTSVTANGKRAWLSVTSDGKGDLWEVEME